MQEHNFYTNIGHYYKLVIEWTTRLFFKKMYTVNTQLKTLRVDKCQLQSQIVNLCNEMHSMRLREIQ